MPCWASRQPKRNRLHPHAASGCKFSTTAGRLERQRQSPAVTLKTLARRSACDSDGDCWTRLPHLRCRRCLRCLLCGTQERRGQRPLESALCRLAAMACAVRLAAGRWLLAAVRSTPTARGSALLSNQARRTRIPWSLRVRLAALQVRSGQGLLALLQEAFTPGAPCRRVAESQDMLSPTAWRPTSSRPPCCCCHGSTQ